MALRIYFLSVWGLALESLFCEYDTLDMDAMEYDFAREDPDFDTDAFGGRRAARHELLKLCPGRWDLYEDYERNILVLSTFGDGITSENDAANKVFQLVMMGWVGLVPPVPAINRWNKVYFPIVWWMLGIVFYSVVPLAFLAVKAQQIHDMDVAGVDVDAMGLLGSQFFKALRVVRWKRGTKWVVGEIRSRNLQLTAIVMKPLLHFMGSTFASARSGVWGSIEPYLRNETSPAVRILCTGGVSHLPTHIIKIISPLPSTLKLVKKNHNMHVARRWCF